MEEYGAPEVLRAVERDAAAPGAGEVAVRTRVAGVNRADCFIRAGTWPQGGGFPYVPGLELCGVVEEVGPGVSGLAAGDPVITMMQRLGGIHGTRAGGYQERAVVPADTLARVPASLELERAGELGLPAVTALLAIQGALDVRAGQRVLVHAATSAVGMCAVQLLAARGCHVIATGTRPGKLERVRALGAAELVVTVGDWSAGLEPVDRVFDLVGQATFTASVELLAPGGRLVFVGGTSGAELAFSGWALMRPVTLTGWSSEALDRAQLEWAMQGIADAAAAGALRVAEVTRVPLAEASRAHALLESGSVAGRIVLVV